MVMTTCRECGKGVSSVADRCPHCGIEHPSRAAQGRRAARNLTAMLIIGGGVYACTQLMQEDAGSGYSDGGKGVALYHCQQAIRAVAKNPSSAEIPPVADQGTDGNHSFVWPKGRGLTMMNAFGANLDTSAACTTNADGNKIVSLYVGDQKIL